MAEAGRRAADLNIAVVINPSSGAFLDGRITAEHVAERLADSGCAAVVEPNDGRGLTELVESAAKRPGIDALVVGGGDGTIVCAAEKLQGTGVALGILPLGTMNQLSRDVGIPGALEDAIASLSGGQRQRIDVGEVNGRLFLIKAVLGTPTKLARLREARRGRMTLRALLRIIAAAFRLLGRDPPLVVTLESGGERRRLRTRALAVVNNDFEEGLGQVFARSRLDAGHLTVYAALNLSARRALRLGLAMALGSWRRTPGLVRFETTEVTIESRRRTLRVMLDGELRQLRTPLRFRISPKALDILVPAAKAGANAGGPAQASAA